VTLIKTYPESIYVPDAYIYVGSYYSERDNTFKAAMAYQKAAVYKDSPVFAYANYRLAWCFYNVAEYQKAIETMKIAVFHAKEEKLKKVAEADLQQFYEEEKTGIPREGLPGENGTPLLKPFSGSPTP
jgi:tetratricopeptide (TPR) repeat protein